MTLQILNSFFGIKFEKYWLKNQMEKTIIDPSEVMPTHCCTSIPIPFETMIVCWSQFVHESVHIAYLPTRVGILPAGLIPKTTQNYKPLWVPNPKIPIDFRDKPNPTHTRGFFRVIPLGTQGYPP